MPQYAAVRIEYLGFGDKSHIFVTVYHRQVPGICLVEFFHHLVHGVVYVYPRRRHLHEFVYMQFAV